MAGKYLFSRETFLIAFGLTDTRVESVGRFLDLQRRKYYAASPPADAGSSAAHPILLMARRLPEIADRKKGNNKMRL